MTRLRSMFPALVLGALVLLPGGVAAQEASASPGPERRDLYLDMPYYIGGYEPDIVLVRGEEHFAGLGPDDPARIELEGLLDEVGADIEDMVSGYALVSLEGFFGFVVAIRVEGVEPGSLLPAYLPILMDKLIDPISTSGNVGGRDVLVISSLGDDGEYVDLYVYDQGDTIWMVQGPSEVAEVTLANLPGPISSE